MPGDTFLIQPVNLNLKPTGSWRSYVTYRSLACVGPWFAYDLPVIPADVLHVPGAFSRVTKIPFNLSLSRPWKEVPCAS